MKFKVQIFNDKQLALLFSAFCKCLFTRPKENDIFTISLYDENNSCKFLFNPTFHQQLNDEMHRAMILGKFASSNANDLWVDLLMTVAAAFEIEFDAIPQGARDYAKISERYW